MNLSVSQQTEARLMEAARRAGVSVDTLIDRLINERTVSTPPAKAPAEAPTVFDQGLGLFGSPEDAALLDEVVSLVYTERRRLTKEQPLAL